MKQQHFALSVCAIAAALALTDAHAQSNTSESVVITGKRENRVSKGATGLPMEIKDTPQSISTIDQEVMSNFGATGSNDALRLVTGITVEEWETNRTTYKARGFDIMLTQIDGLGMANDWGIAEGQLDTYVFERIEVIRGANGLLTGVGNASGTINYVRKRPTNKDGGEAIVSGGSYNLGRVALDYNKVLTDDGAWAGRLVAAYEDKDSYLRALHDRRSTVYGVIDGQIGSNGVLTAGFGYADSKQQSPMWGSLTLRHADGSQADFDVSASTSQDWTQWYKRSYNAFVEYTHTLSADWDAKVTYNRLRGADDTKLFYAYTFSGTLNPDNTGLVGWPYRSDGTSGSDIVDANLSGRFGAWGLRHEAMVGLSYSKQKSYAVYNPVTSPPGPALPAFPYPGNVYPEPTWGDALVSADGDQKLTRLYAAARLSLTDRMKGIVGINAIDLRRDGTSIYGGGTALDDDKTSEASPYLGVTYDITPNALAYASYSDIFQAQDQRDVNGQFLPPMRGVNTEIGVKAEWLDRKLLTTFAVFGAEQKGLATEAGFDPVAQQSWYEPKDVKSRGFEIEASGRLTQDSRLTVGYTQLRLTGPDGNDIYEWVPRKTFNALIDGRFPGLPQLGAGFNMRWQSDVSKIAGAAQGSYAVANAYLSWDLTPAATLRLNVDNLFDEKYLKTVEFGAIYGPPRNGALTLEYRL